MRHIPQITCVLMLAFGNAMCAVVNAADATSELFNLVDNGGCESDSLTGNAWVISTSPLGTHGELILGDRLAFELIGSETGIARKSAIEVTRNGLIWESVNGWSGQCVRDGNLSLYVLSGDIDIDGCLHELAIGRLDHDDSLAKKIEVVFQGSKSENAEECQHFIILHPGHAHGTQD